jgi:hypothetical protein
MTLDEADSVPPYYAFQNAQRYSVGPFDVVLDPRMLDQGVLTRADVFVLRMIQDGYNERPIYFSRTAGSYPQQLGLGDNILTQGLADRVWVPPATATGKDTIFIQGEGWFDLSRTLTLWNDVFMGHNAIIKKGHWIDKPSQGIPYLYVATGLGLAHSLQSVGDTVNGRAVQQRALNVGRAVGLNLGPQTALEPVGPPDTGPPNR